MNSPQAEVLRGTSAPINMSVRGYLLKVLLGKSVHKLLIILISDASSILNNSNHVFDGVPPNNRRPLAVHL